MTRDKHLTRGVFNCHLHLRLRAPSPSPGTSSREAGRDSRVRPSTSRSPCARRPSGPPPPAATGDARAEPGVAKPSGWVNHPAPRPHLGTEAEHTPRRGLLPLPARSAPPAGRSRPGPGSAPTCTAGSGVHEKRCGSRRLRCRRPSKRPLRLSPQTLCLVLPAGAI